MARIRTIKPEFWTSEQVMECSPIARLLFVGMWNFCDDGGNHPASVKTLKAEVFPADDLTPACIQGMVDELVEQGLLIPYEADGKRFLHVTGWHHQKIEKPNFKHPSPTDQGESEDQTHTNQDQVSDNSPTNRRPVADHSTPEGNGMEGKGSKPTSSLRSEGEKVAAEENPAQPAAGKPDEPDSLLSAIYEVGRPVMLAGGCSAKSAGSLLGRLRKELGDLDALVVVEAMAREAPIDAASWVAGAIKARQSKAVSLDEFMAACRANGEPVVSGYTPVFEYAEQAGIPDEFIRLGWDEFKRRHMPGGIWAKTKREDWRLSFLAALQTNALRLWYSDQKTQSLCLTAAGLQAEMAGRAAA